MAVTDLFSPVNLPFFIYDIYNLQLITIPHIPLGDISDVKSIVLSETPIPGLGFNPINVGGMGNRKVGFRLPLLKKDNEVGNVMLVKQFENLRNQSFGGNLTGLFTQQAQFTPNPKVLFYWGSGSGVPLEWYVAKCDFDHKSLFVNKNGYPQYSEIEIELILDETSLLYKAEEIFRKFSSILAGVL
jgi:hypothetical protein